MEKTLQRREQGGRIASPFVTCCLAAFLLLPLLYGINRSYTFYFAQPIQILSQSSEQQKLERVTPQSRGARFMVEVAFPATR